jgi:hypothetical protein
MFSAIPASVLPTPTYLTSIGRDTNFGACEYCGTITVALKLIKIEDFEPYFWTKKQANFYTQPFWACNRCMTLLSRIGTKYKGCHYMIKEEPLDRRLLESGHIRNTLIRKMRTLEEIFPAEIDGVFVIPPKQLPEKFHEQTNIMVSFKNLSLLNYFRFVMDRDVCLMHIWKDAADNKFSNRAKFWRARDTRILLALGRIHFQSELLSVWVWSETRMVSIEFFCKTPVNMIQARPKKILRIT